ncbi:MAG TPA: hypothetical protein VIF57_08685, partial [Polyangia bacterium]
GATASVEALFNLNREGKALDADTGMPGVDAFHDTRLIGKLGLTTTLFARLSVAFGFTLRYDQNPPPRPIPAGTASGAVYIPGFQPFADRADTRWRPASSERPSEPAPRRDPPRGVFLTFPKWTHYL